MFYYWGDSAAPPTQSAPMHLTHKATRPRAVAVPEPELVRDPRLCPGRCVEIPTSRIRGVGYDGYPPTSHVITAPICSSYTEGMEVHLSADDVAALTATGYL